MIAGVDEVGRGALAGPVVAAAVILPSKFSHPLIQDSKTIPAKKRLEILPIIYANAVSVGIGVICPIIIDEINILNATKEAMQRSLAALRSRYDFLIIDSVKLNNLSAPFIHPNKADRDYIQVAAASIVAKVYRDSLMRKLASFYPRYGWERNAGYGTKSHTEAIKKHGVTPLHRKTFLKKIEGE